MKKEDVEETENFEYAVKCQIQSMGRTYNSFDWDLRLLIRAISIVLEQRFQDIDRRLNELKSSTSHE